MRRLPASRSPPRVSGAGRTHDRPRDIQRVARRFHVVHAKEPRATLERRDVRADRPADAFARLRDAGDLADEPLARRADENRISQRDEPRKLGHHRDRRRASLGEPDARIQDDPVWRDAGALRAAGRGAQFRDDFTHGIVAVRGVGVRRHGGNVATRVHQDNPRPRGAADARHRVVEPKAGDVVHDRRAGLERRMCDRGLGRIDRDRDGGMISTHRLNEGHDTTLFFLRVHGSGALRPSRLSADVDHVRALGDQPLDVSARFVERAETAAVAEAVRCHVHDSQDARAVERQDAGGVAPHRRDVAWRVGIGFAHRRP